MTLIRTYFKTVQETDVADLVSYLMIATLLIYAPDVWYCKVPLLLLSILALVQKDFRRSFWMWYLCGLINFLAIYYTWYEADNHKYVLAYICLMLGFAFYTPRVRPERVLLPNGRILLSTAMGFAVVWKVASTDYFYGDFFRLTLVSDERFSFFARLLTSISLEEFKSNIDNLAVLKLSHIDLTNSVQEVQVLGLKKVEWLAIFMTWWTVVIETAIAAAFLFCISEKRNAQIFAHSLLCFFIVTTYAVATVPGFCLALVILGICATRKEESYFRPVYVLCALLVQVYMIPFAQMFQY